MMFGLFTTYDVRARIGDRVEWRTVKVFYSYRKALYEVERLQEVRTLNIEIRINPAFWDKRR